MNPIKFLKDYLECYRTEKKIRSLIWQAYDYNYDTMKEANGLLSQIYGLMDRARVLNKTSSAGVLGYIPVKRLEEGVMRLEQQVDEAYFAGLPPK